MTESEQFIRSVLATDLGAWSATEPIVQCLAFGVLSQRPRAAAHPDPSYRRDHISVYLHAIVARQVFERWQRRIFPPLTGKRRPSLQSSWPEWNDSHTAIIRAMEPAEIESFVFAIIHEQKTIDPEALNLDTNLRDVGFDSLDALNVLFSIEDRFEMVIPDEVARSIETPKDMVRAIEEILREKPPA